MQNDKLLTWRVVPK